MASELKLGLHESLIQTVEYPDHRSNECVVPLVVLGALLRRKRGRYAPNKCRADRAPTDPRLAF